MGSGATYLPCLDLTKDPEALEPGSQVWQQLCQSVREALETFGGVMVEYDKLPEELREDMFAFMKELFDLPVKTKRKLTISYPHYPYAGTSDLCPHYQALGMMNSVLPEEARAFTQLMWPDGNDRFRQTLHSMSVRFLELVHIIMKMIFDSYGVRRSCYDSHIGGTESHIRMSKYSAPMKGEAAIGLTPHVDRTLISVLLQNEVEGIEFKSKEGEWFPVNPGKGSFVVFVGQALQAWSNGRLYAPVHKVMISGFEDRFSCGLFFRPKGDEIVEARGELVDDEHPTLFKPFTYNDFLKHAPAKGLDEDSLKMYAGI